MRGIIVETYVYSPAQVALYPTSRNCNLLSQEYANLICRTCAFSRVHRVFNGLWIPATTAFKKGVYMSTSSHAPTVRLQLVAALLHG